MTPALNRRLNLQESRKVPDRAGGFAHYWVTLGTLWAEVLPGSGSLGSRSGLPAQEQVFKITIRAAPPGSEARPRIGQRLIEADRAMMIEAVTERDAEGRYLICRAREEKHL